jgi:Ca2+-binding EF-hand superfamily protein
MMSKRRTIVWAIVVLLTARATARVAVQKQSTGSPKEVVSSKEKKVEAGDEYTRKLLLLMDTDKNGKVSKQEFMSFMEKEFDRLDSKKDGQLDVQELTKLRSRPDLGK